MAGRQDVFAFLRFSWQGSSGGSPLPGIRYCLEQYGAGTECGNPSAARARARQPDSEGSYIYPAAAARQSRRRVLIGRSTLRVLPITLCHPFGSTDKVRTLAISGSRPWTFHHDRFYRESAASRCSIFRFCSFSRGAATWGELEEHLRAAESHIKLKEEICLTEDNGNTVALAPGEGQPDWRESFYLPSQDQASRF